MLKNPKELSVAELERLLSARKMQLDDLEKKRERLRKELARVEEQMRDLGGTRSGGVVRSGAVQAQNKISLHKVVTELLTKNRKGLPLGKLADQVLATGYKTFSTNFKNVLYQCLYNSKHIVHDPDNACYKLKAGPIK